MQEWLDIIFMFSFFGIVLYFICVLAAYQWSFGPLLLIKNEMKSCLQWANRECSL